MTAHAYACACVWAPLALTHIAMIKKHFIFRQQSADGGFCMLNTLASLFDTNQPLQTGDQLMLKIQLDLPEDTCHCEMMDEAWLNLTKTEMLAPLDANGKPTDRMNWPMSSFKFRPNGTWSFICEVEVMHPPESNCFLKPDHWLNIRISKLKPLFPVKKDGINQK